MSEYYKMRSGGVVYPASYVDDPSSSGVIPVVVIDPEDHEQVERLTGALAINGANPNDRNYWRETQAALRSLIAPPKPDEPTGLGAVVEDAEGVRWVRSTAPHTAPWWRDRTSTYIEWSDLTAVRVLSEGVQ